MRGIDTTERRRELYKVLQSTCEAAPLTTSKLAELLHVSVRTVHYDLDALAEELPARGPRLCRKARRGVWLEGQEQESLQAGSQYSSQLSPKERRERIILALLSGEIRSIDELAEKLVISRNTLLLDLKDVQDTLEQRGLRYESKRGVGIWAEGPEQNVRDMFIHIFAKADYDFRQYEQDSGKDSLSQQPFRFYGEDIPVAEIASRFIAVMKKHGVLENDASTNRMVCALVVQVKRLRQGMISPAGRAIEFLSDEGEAMKSLAMEIAQALAAYHGDVMKAGEVEYLIRELLHSRIYLFAKKNPQDDTKDVNMRAIKLAREFVEYAQVWLGDIYLDDEELIYNLALHLQPAIERARFGIVLTNPLLGQIQEQYRSLYLYARKAAEKISERVGISFTEDEIGYLTIHLGAAVERRRLRQNNKLSVLLVCGNGVGTANLLAMTLRNHLRYIHIEKVVSFYKLEDENLENIDLIISTVPLDLEDVAVLRVSPIATAEEIKVIESQIEYFYSKKFSALPLAKNVVQPGLTDLLVPNTIALDCQAESWQDAVRQAGELLQEAGAVTGHYVNRMVSCVEEMGPYIVVCPGVAMPHARYEDGVNKVAVSFLRLKQPVAFGPANDPRPVDMLFAFSTTDEKAHLRLLEDLWHIFSDKQALGQLHGSQSEKEILTYLHDWQASSNG